MFPEKKYRIQYEHFDSLLALDRVSGFMSTPPITLRKDESLADAKAIMRDYRISGIPVVDKEGILIGLITLEDIIIALEKGYIEEPIEKHMIKDIVTLSDDTNISTVIEYLMTYSYGRYPVIDKNRKVLGVVTNIDLVIHILERLGNVYLHNKRRDEILTRNRYLLSPEPTGTDQCFSYEIESKDLDIAGEGATLFKKHLQKHNVSPDIIRRASIALYEAEVNVVLHATGKGRIKGYLKDDQLVILISDDGPGIDNIEEAMQPGFTTASDEIRERGFGAGLGLANIKKYTDKLSILSSKTGLKMEMVMILGDK